VKNKEFLVAGAVLTLVTYTLALSLAGQVLSAAQTSKKVPNTGTLEAIGVSVYWDNECTNVVDSIDWGVLEPGSNKNTMCYIRNEGNSVTTLSMHTSNWSPSKASNHIILSWDYGGQSLDVDEAVQVTFTLDVDASINGITSFSFDITIVGNG
jgi:hypothetical protein